MKALSRRIIRSQHDLPSLEITQGFLGEYCWHPAYEETDGWAKPDSWHKIPVATQPLDTEYSAKQCEFDYSLGETFRFKLPAPGLLKGLNVHLSDGKNVSYADPTGKVLFFDPSTKEEGPSAALVNHAALLEFLKREKLQAVWIVTCSKEAFGSKRHNSGWGGQRQKTSIYWMTKKGFARKTHDERKHPANEQLKQFLDKDNLRESSTRARRTSSNKGKAKKIVPRRSPTRRKQKQTRESRRKRPTPTSR